MLLHDDKAREFEYTAGTEKSLELAQQRLDRGEHEERLEERVGELEEGS